MIRLASQPICHMFETIFNWLAVNRYIPSHGIDGGETLYIHSPHLQFLPARDSNSQPLDYESDSNHYATSPRLCWMLLILNIIMKCSFIVIYKILYN